MKKTVFLTTIIALLLVDFRAFAKKIDGFYVTLQGDTIKAQFKVDMNIFYPIPHRFSLQKKIIVFDSLGNKKVFKPFEIRSFTLKYPVGEADTFISLAWGRDELIRSDSQFVRLINADSPIKLYQYYNRSSDQQDVSMYLLEKEQKFIAIDFLFFRKAILPLINDYQELAQKVDAKKLTINDIETIVKQYNYHKNNFSN